MINPSRAVQRWRLMRVLFAVVAACGLALSGVAVASAAHVAKPAPAYKSEAGGSPQTAKAWTKPHAVGGLDCNGMSPIQKTINNKVCTDIKGIRGINNKFTYDGRFYDNGRYIGHDEPIVRYFSGHTGSGNNVVWHETLGKDPAALPTVNTPGKDVTHNVELTVAPWFGMALCNQFSYPLLPCKPDSDVNAPASVNAPVPAGAYPGGGSSFLEMQFYPPGMAPFVDNISCDNTHWCASLHINDLECTTNFASCNPHCEEPTNFAFIQSNGVPTGPPSPQLSDIATSTPDSNTLLMNSGDHLVIHMSDAAVPGETGQKALKLSIDDLSTGQSGFMQASAKNGFMATNINDCSGTPFNYQPEYNTAGPRNIVPWAADQIDIATQFEIGHFEACSTVTNAFPVSDVIPGINDTFWNGCTGPYENAGPPDNTTPETGDAFCYPAGDTHTGYEGVGTSVPPNVVSGCEDNILQNGDLDFDGNPYWPDWPNSTKPNTFPSTFLQAQPTSNGVGYPQFQFQTDAALSEASCAFPNGTGCKVPPPGAPGKFYPYWTLTKSCHWEFGNNTNGNTFGKDAQYGSIKVKVGYPQMFGPVMKNTCDT
jgi:hypothetical protein